MRKLLCLLFAFLPGAWSAVDLSGMQPIAPVASFRSTASAIVITCEDRSEVWIEPLAADLVRVRASFGRPLEAEARSWAIAKTEWETPKWSVAEKEGAIVVSTAEVEVTVRRAPLLVEFRDARTHRVFTPDFQPMMRNPKTGAIAVARRLGFDEHFYGLGEKAAHLDRRRGDFVMWNTDAFGYKEGTDPLYQSIPFYMGLENGAAYGMFFANSYRTRFDLGVSSQEYVAFAADGGPMTYYYFHGPSMKKILGRYAELTGHMPLPPRWALGHQQSRYSYYPDKMVEEVVAQYRARDLPLDAVHLDIHYMNGYRLFTWDPRLFPNPKALADKLAKQGAKLVTIVDPGVKVQPSEAGATDPTDKPELAPQDRSYYVYNQGLAGDYYLKRKDGRTWIGEVWPGKAVWVDYTLEKAARWWGDLFRAYLDQGVAGIWTDMNEPSDFVDQTGQSQIDVVAWDGGAKSTFAKVRNEFALHMTRATYEGLQRLRPRERPYVITRAGSAGIQRYSTMWTGDNTASWEHLALSIPMYQSAGLSGEPFLGGDVGGFTGRCDAELLTRWYQVGLLTPFFRNHADLKAYDHEPWRFGSYYEDIIRKYLKLRYRLLPYMYTVLDEAHRTGLPLFRPLLLNYQDDANLVNVDDEFMVGDDLLAAPILRPGATSRLVYLPRGVWYDFWTGAREEGGRMLTASAPLETIPLYVRGGAALPLGPEMNWVGEKPNSPITFAIYPDAQGAATAVLYEDDGISPDYRNGAWRRTHINVAKRMVTVSEEGSWNGPKAEMRFEVWGGEAKGERLSATSQ